MVVHAGEAFRSVYGIKLSGCSASIEVAVRDREKSCLEEIVGLRDEEMLVLQEYVHDRESRSSTSGVRRTPGYTGRRGSR